MKNLVSRCFVFLAAAGALTAPSVAGCGGGGGHPSGAGGSSSGVGGMATTGMGGAGGGGGDCSAAACPPPTNNTLDCSHAVTPNALVTDFGTCTYRSSIGKFGLCPLTGSVYPYKGDATVLPDGAAPSMAAASVDYMTDHNFQFTAMVSPGGYAGAGLQFDFCADVSSFTGGIQFTLGGTTDCDLELQFATFSQRPTSQPTLPGGCDSMLVTCYNYPVAKKLTTPTATDTTPITVTVPFSTVTNWTPDSAKELVGLQFQATSPAPPDGGSEQPACNVALRIDDIMFY